MQLWIKDSNPELTLSAFQVTCDQDARLHFSVTEFSAYPRKNNNNNNKKRTHARRLPFKNQAQGLGSSRNASSLVRDKPNGRLRRRPVYTLPVTHLNTATSFLNPCNCCGLGSETFSVFIATAPIIQTH